MSNTTNEAPATVNVHPWETAGLGLAPFRFMGSFRSVYQAIPGDPSCPLQPGSSCDYCGQGIYQVCRIRDAKGAEFKVGADCVGRLAEKCTAGLSAADKKMIREAKRVKNAAATEARHAREAVKLARLTALGDREDVRAMLASFPHPRGAWAGTLLDSYDNRIRLSGTAGKLACLAEIELLIANTLESDAAKI